MSNEMKNIEKNILPIKNHPITSYPVYASYFSVLAAYTESEVWLYANLTNLWAHFDENLGPQFKFSSWKLPYCCPFIEHTLIRSEMYSSLNEFPIGFIEQMII